uniref:Protein kinase domain-containing protein n=1 Tax=Panagrolaimus davidi TaxID=227884 RepID=A0A914PMV5_9BILA
MLGCITVGDEICLVLEFCSNLDLHAFLKDLKVNKKELEEDQKVVRKEFFIFAWQISHGLQYLASQEIIHRNLTAKNILVDSEKNAKICDFGLAIHESQTNEFISTSDKRKLATKWLAIECFENDEFSYKSDMQVFK